jgi:hypothetical protein
LGHAFHVLFAGPPGRRIISVKRRTLPLHVFTGDRGFESISLQERVSELSVPQQQGQLCALVDACSVCRGDVNGARVRMLAKPRRR